VANVAHTKNKPAQIPNIKKGWSESEQIGSGLGRTLSARDNILLTKGQKLSTGHRVGLILETLIGCVSWAKIIFTGRIYTGRARIAGASIYEDPEGQKSRKKPSVDVIRKQEQERGGHGDRIAHRAKWGAVGQ